MKPELTFSLLSYMHVSRSIIYVQSQRTPNPSNLKGLSQAIYVLECLEQGKTEQEIIGEFDGDKQLVKIWTAFLLHTYGYKKEMSELEGDEQRWAVTGKGKEWTKGHVTAKQSYPEYYL